MLRFVTVSLWPETEMRRIHPGIHCFKKKTLIVLSPFDISMCRLGGECRSNDRVLGKVLHEESYIILSQR